MVRTPRASAGVGLGGELAAQPPDGIGHQLVVAVLVPGPVLADDVGEVVPAGHLGQVAEPFGDDRADADAAAAGNGLGGGDEPFDDAGQGAAVRGGAGGEVADQLGVQGAGRPAGGLQPPVRGEVGLGGDELLLLGDGGGQVQEERLARAVIADHESDHRTAVRDPVEVVGEGGDLVRPADLNVREPALRDHAGPQRADDGVAVTRA